MSDSFTPAKAVLAIIALILVSAAMGAALDSADQEGEIQPQTPIQKAQ